jgi:4-diphosphocytidyl-2-C-methyl-D-erythritol kinase
MLKLKAPAKVNLTLEVLGERPDGYHEIRTIIQAVGLYDVLSLEPAQGLEVQPETIGGEQNLVTKAARLLKEATGTPLGARLRLEKRTPLRMGLGGHSSDAAATLMGLNQLWRLGLSREGLLPLAQSLGSDVPFFLYGGTGLVEGKGERVTPLPNPPPQSVVLLCPTLPTPTEKTRRLYQALTPEAFTQGQYTLRGKQALLERDELEPFNAFEMVAFSFFPGLEDYRQRFLASGATRVHLAGSGPALFTLTRDRALAKRMCSSLRCEGVEAHLVSTLRGGKWPTGLSA